MGNLLPFNTFMYQMKNACVLFFIATFFALTGCHPEPNGAELYDELVVATNFDPAANFSAYKTFAIPDDTLGFISNTDPNDSLLVSNNSSFPEPVVNAIVAGLKSRGFTRVSKNEDPDLGIRAIVVHDLNVFQQVVYPNSAYGPGGYYSGYYGYSSWYYYPYVNTYTYKNAMLIIEMLDLKNKTANNEVKVVWAAYMGDLYGTIHLIEQTERAIEQSFIQSPFISTSQQ
jgi:hypothetical protein